jgi:hypothetical protein
VTRHTGAQVLTLERANQESDVLTARLLAIRAGGGVRFGLCDRRHGGGYCRRSRDFGQHR